MILSGRPAAGGWTDPVKNRRAERFEIDNWLVSDFVAQVLLPKVGTRPYPLNELMLMVGAVCWLEPTDIFEWGTHKGTSALVFWETCERFQIPARILSVDLPDDVGHVEHPGRIRGTLVRGKDRVELLQGDGLALSLQTCRALPDDARVLFFLDGDHSLASVRRELESIVTTVPGAVILVHDTFYQSATSGYNVGPFEAIEQVLSDTPRPYERVSPSTGLPGMTLLIPRP